MTTYAAQPQTPDFPADDRTEYIKGLRLLADLLAANPDLPLPYHGTSTGLLWIKTHGDNSDDVRNTARLFARLIPGAISKHVRDDVLDLDGSIAGLRVALITARDAMCERVVTGTREVTIEATPAMPATEAQPERTETVEDFEWICGSLLADAAPVSA